jgi:dienelactone hydrolase
VDGYLADLVDFREWGRVLSDPRGPILKGYVSEIDNTLQPYSVFVPYNYRDYRPFPLVVSLHGHGWFGPFQGHPAPEMEGAIVLSPEGRGATDYMWIGENDVLRAIEEVKKDYLIDASRIFITGGSMGGTGAWNLGVHYPHLFAGVLPRAANCDFRAWERRWGWNPPLEPEHRRLREFLLESDSPITCIANLVPTPVYVAHAAGDEVVPVEHAREAVARLRELGANVEYREFLVGSHGDLPDWVRDEGLAWLASRPRLEPPRKYRYQARDLRHGRAFYVVIEQMEKVLEPASVDVELKDDELDVLDLAVKTSNVAALTVMRGELPSLPDEGPIAVTLKLDGKDFQFSAESRMEPITFERSEGTWRKVSTWPPEGSLRKVRGLAGPVQDVFLSPFTVVWGTGGKDENWSRAAREEAERFVDEWKRRYGGRCRIVADNALTTRSMEGLNIAFFGWPGANTFLKPVIASLPITVDDNGVTMNGEIFADEGAGTIFCYPNPHAPGRMIAVFTATDPAALYQVWTRFDNWFNWGVYDCRKWFDYCVYNSQTANPETFPAVGFFGTDWTFENGRRWDDMSEVVVTMEPQGVPRYTVAPDDNALYLSRLRPVKIDQMRGAVGFDRSFRGHAIRISGKTYDYGLGVRCPSRIEYDLGGKFSTLTAVVGLTEEPEEAQSSPRRNGERVRFVVTGDGKELHVEKVDWMASPRKLNVSVSGVKKLVLSVEPAGGALWLHGSSAWADLKVER